MDGSGRGPSASFGTQSGFGGTTGHECHAKPLLSGSNGQVREQDAAAAAWSTATHGSDASPTAHRGVGGGESSPQAGPGWLAGGGGAHVTAPASTLTGEEDHDGERGEAVPDGSPIATMLSGERCGEDQEGEFAGADCGGTSPAKGNEDGELVAWRRRLEANSGRKRPRQEAVKSSNCVWVWPRRETAYRVFKEYQAPQPGMPRDTSDGQAS